MDTTIVQAYHREQTKKRRKETQIVKRALEREGYTGVRVGHGTGTARGWLHIKAEPLPGQTWHEMNRAVVMIAQAMTWRHGEYDGRINVG